MPASSPSRPARPGDRGTDPFEQETRETVRDLADALADLVEAAAGSIPTPAELGRRLQVDKKLGWKISKIILAPDVFAAVEHVPGAAGMEIVLKAAARQGAPAAAVTRVRDAFARFESLIETHAGDRLSLEMMARGHASELSDQAELSRRRDAFLGHSYTWGVQARTQLSANIVFASDDGVHLDIVLLSGLVDLRRLRPKVAWVVARLGYVGPTTSPAETSGELPAERIPLLRAFCSQPLPALRAVTQPGGFVEIEVDEGPVGNRGAMTCFFGGDPIRRAGLRYHSREDPSGELHVHVRTPSRVLVHDLIVESELFGPLRPEAAVFSEVHHEVRSARARDERYRLPVPLAVEHLGRGASRLRTPDVPRYPEMVRAVLERAGRDPERFDVYRLRMEYPIVPTAVIMSFPLPEAPPR